MIDVSRIWVRSFDLDHLDVWWEIKNTVEDHLLYSFYIQRSEAAMGPWDTLGGPFKDKWFYRDITVNRFHKHRQFFYRLRIVEDSSGDESFSEAASLSAEPDLIAKEIIRRMALLLREFTGRKCILFPVRTFGTRCSDCWDSIRQRKTKDRCITCYGTGFAGGYMTPMLVYVQMDPEPDSQTVSAAGEFQTSKTTARALPYPLMKPNDLLVEPENKRWVVNTVSSTRKLRSPVHLEMQLHELSPGHMAYKLPINLDAKLFEPSPGREFTNPQMMESLEEKDAGFYDEMAAYGYPHFKLFHE